MCRIGILEIIGSIAYGTEGGAGTVETVGEIVGAGTALLGCGVDDGVLGQTDAGCAGDCSVGVTGEAGCDGGADASGARECASFFAVSCPCRRQGEIRIIFITSIAVSLVYTSSTSLDCMGTYLTAVDRT